MDMYLYVIFDAKRCHLNGGIVVMMTMIRCVTVRVMDLKEAQNKDSH